MVDISQNTLGVDLAAIYTPQDFKPQTFSTGDTVIGDDGNLYQYAVASEAITADTAVVLITVVSGEYSAAATGGSSTSPGTDMATGDHAFFALT